MEYYFKTACGQSPQNKQEILKKFSHTRLADNYELVERLVKSLKPVHSALLLGLLIYGEDPFYNDILTFAQHHKLNKVYDAFANLADLSTLVSFMNEIDESNKKRKYEFVGQSSMDASVKIGEEHVESSGETVEQTVTFIDNVDMPVLDLTQEADETRMNEDNMQVSSLGKFLERPLIIARYVWNLSSFGGGQFVDISPWAAYLQDSTVANKVTNFRLFRARGMRISFRVNGSPFHYGRLMAGYCPGPYTPLVLAGMQNPSAATVVPTNMGTFNATARPLKTHYSQWPSVFIDPTTNMPQTMDIPFMWPQNYCSLVSTGDVLDIGFIRIWVLTPLRHANGATDPINVTVTAHMLDPVLSMPTPIGAFTGESFVAQSGKAGTNSKASPTPKTRKEKNKNKGNATNNNGSSGKNDEYGKGAVSAPASALANFAGTLEKVPVIGQYATATKIAASGIAKIASLFGYSRPTLVGDMGRVVIEGCTSLATVEGGDGSHKLTLDPKQEITVDPTVVGLQSHDEMALAHLFKRESLLVEIPWNTSSAGGSNLCHIGVGPWNHPINVTNGIHFHTALSWASYPFQWWRGSLKYRFQVVASQMHRGRLAIVYNPRVEGAITATLPSQTTTHQVFMDLTECRDMTVVVRYAHPNPWLNNQPVPGAFTTSGSATFPPALRVDFNGMLSVYVLNELAAPTNTANITVNVFISAGDDFMVAGPGTDIHLKTAYAQSLQGAYGSGLASGDEMISSPSEPSLEGESFVGQSSTADYSASNELMPVKTDCVVINGSEDDTPDVDNVNSVFFGEQVVSLRAFLKRFTHYTTWFPWINSPTNAVVIQCLHGSIPMSRGAAGINGNDHLGQNSTGSPRNFVYTTLIDWYRHGFIAYRGAIRFKYIVHSTQNMTVPGALRVFRHTPPTDTRYLRTLTTNVTGTAANANEQVRITTYEPFGARYSSGGAALAYLRQSNSLQFEHPFYCPLRFIYNKRAPPTISSAATPNSVRAYQAQYLIRDAHVVQQQQPNTQVNSTTSGSYEIWVAAAEDFSLHYFIGAPVFGFQGYES